MIFINSFLYSSLYCAILKGAAVLLDEFEGHVQFAGRDVGVVREFEVFNGAEFFLEAELAEASSNCLWGG